MGRKGLLGTRFEMEGEIHLQELGKKAAVSHWIDPSQHLEIPDESRGRLQYLGEELNPFCSGQMFCASSYWC